MINKKPQALSIYKTTIILTVVLLIGVVGWYAWSKHNTTSPQNIIEGSRVAYAGKIESADLSAMATDGAGIFVVKTDSQQITVHLTSGESFCDRSAIKVPKVNVGSEVTVSGDKGSDGIVRVCKSGTYIKARD